MSVMLDKTSARLFQTTRTVFQTRCRRLIDDILHNGLSLEDELNDRVGQLHLSLEQLKRAGQMMAIDCSTNELVEPADVARNLETQSFLWDLAMPFPVTISQAEDSAPGPYVNALQIPPAASMARMNSRIPVRPRPPPPVDTYLAYNRPVPETPA